MKRFFLMVVSAVLVLWVLPLGADAAEVIPDGKKGSITLELKYDGEYIKDGFFSCIQVADVVCEGADYYFRQLLEPDVIYRDEIPDAGDMNQLVRDNPTFFIANKISHTNTTGTIRFGGLEPGLYLILQETASAGYTKLEPFLVSVPYNVNGTYVYDVDASVKLELLREPETVPTEPPTEPPTKVPPTGQLTWPVPVLASVGMVLFVMGWLIAFGGRKEWHDA